MTTADQKFELLSAFVDGELSAAERCQVEAWLADDADLQRAHREMIALGDKIRALPSPRLAVEFTASVMNRIAAASEPTRPVPAPSPLTQTQWLRLAAVAMTIAAAALLAVVFAPSPPPIRYRPRTWPVQRLLAACWSRGRPSWFKKETPWICKAPSRRACS